MILQAYLTDFFPPLFSFRIVCISQKIHDVFYYCKCLLIKYYLVATPIKSLPDPGRGQRESGRGVGRTVGDGADGGKEAGGVLKPGEAREVIVHGRADGGGEGVGVRPRSRFRMFAVTVVTHFNLARPSNQLSPECFQREEEHVVQ